MQHVQNKGDPFLGRRDWWVLDWNEAMLNSADKLLQNRVESAYEVLSRERGAPIEKRFVGM